VAGVHVHGDVSMAVLVHKAVEPSNTTKAGRALYNDLLDWLAGMDNGTPAIIQPKYDGVYVQFIYGPDGWAAFSRTGEPLLSVSQRVLDLFEYKALPERHYVGELWLPATSHSTINGMARQKRPSPLGVVLFDSFIPGDNEVYLERQEFLFSGGDVSIARTLPPYVGGLESVERDLYDMARLWTQSASAYDGLILRDEMSVYTPGDGRDGGVYKIKPRHTGDFRVVGVTPGKGKHTGSIGALVVDLGGGVTCEVGTGLNDRDRKDPDWVGRIVEVEYLAVTKDGKLREPSFQRVRWDKKVPDVIVGNVVSED